LLGYLLNFLSLLGLLTIFIAFVSGIAILIMIYKRRLSERLFDYSLGVNLILLLVFACYWALAVTSIAHARTTVAKGFTEFYITQTVLSDQREIVQVNITNNSRSENSYRLTITQPNVRREYFVTLEPGNTQIYQFLKMHFLTNQETTLTLVDYRGRENSLVIRKIERVR
jgi:4-amino-4-deoxy-L-arabinose transferase-like glycosyltransferase